MLSIAARPAKGRLFAGAFAPRVTRAMRYPDSFLDEIRARLPVSEVVRQRVQLKKAGREWRGLSPFNKEKTPSFFVNDQKGFYHDFSSGKSGDQFAFLMETEGLSFPEAVERLAQMAGLQLPKESKEAERFEQERKSLLEIMELATQFFEAQFAGTAGQIARDYAKQRGIKEESLREFRIGYAPGNRFALKEYLGKHGIPIEDIIVAGLLIAGDDIPVPYDRFRDRLIIPIHNQKGQVVAFGGRALSSDVQAKYLNSPETPIFHKGGVIFNFHRARVEARERDSVVVVEGYLDAIALYQAGLKSVVASMGTALTEEQIETLWRLSSEPIVCFDADRAGVAAAHRSIDRILPALKVGRSFRFAYLIGGKDPDDVVREQGLGGFMPILENAQPLWDALWKRETTGISIATPDARANLEHRLYETIRAIKDTTVHAAYYRTCRIELSDLFWQQTVRSRQKTKDARFPKLSDELSLKGDPEGLHKTLLGLLVHYPEYLEERQEAVQRIKFSSELSKFQDALYELLVISEDISVEIIYERLSPSFYKVLEEVHGHGSDKLRRGHRLVSRFPIVKCDPPPDFVRRCLEFFLLKIMLVQQAEELNELILGDDPLSSDAAGEMITRLAKKLQEEEARVMAMDMELAEEALEVRRIWGEPEWRTAA